MRAIHVMVVAALVGGCGGGEAQKSAIASPQTPTNAVATAATNPIPAPTQAEEKPAAPKAGAELAQTLRTIADAQKTRDAKKAASIYAEDAELSFPGPSGRTTVTGRDAIEKSYKEQYDGTSNTRFGFSRVWSKGDFAACEWISAFKHSGDLMGMKATDRSASVVGISLVWIGENGLVKKEHRYFDTQTIAGQVGASNAKVRPVMVNVPGSWETIAPNGTEGDKSLDLLKSVYGAWEKRDEAGFLDLLADNVVHEDYSKVEAQRGKDAAKKQLEDFSKNADGLKLKVENGWSMGEWAIAEMTAEATVKSPTNQKKPVKLTSVDVMKVNKDGKVQQIWTYGDQTEALVQLGVIKAPPPPPKKK